MPAIETPSPAFRETIPAGWLLENLPVLPAVATRLLGMMGRPEAALTQISAVISSDPVLAAEVLRMANCAMFGMRRQVSSILEALALLGTERTKALACTVALRNYLGNVLELPPLRRCWRNSLAVAMLAEELASWCQSDGSEAYTAGLLHDMGELALMALSPDRFLIVLEEAAATGVSDPRPLERHWFGFDHCAAGAALALSWNLPAPLCQVLRTHHDPLSAPRSSLAGIVHAAVAGAVELGFGLAGPPPAEPPKPSELERFHAELGIWQRERVRFDLGDLQLLIGTRINAIES